VGVPTNPNHVELGYQVKEISSSGHDELGWYYGRPDGSGALSEKVGPFDSYDEAVKHLEEELFSDDEG
jgi:hypothetical protein